MPPHAVVRLLVRVKAPMAMVRDAVNDAAPALVGVDDAAIDRRATPARRDPQRCLAPQRSLHGEAVEQLDGGDRLVAIELRQRSVRPGAVDRRIASLAGPLLGRNLHSHSPRFTRASRLSATPSLYQFQ